MVLSVTQKDGFFKVKQGYLVFFNDRVIFAVVNQKRQQQEIQLLREKLKAEGKGFFKGTAEIMRFWSNYGNKYYQMPAQSVLNDDPENIEMYYPGISLFHFVSARTQNNVDNTNSESYGKIIIHMGGNKIKFNHRYHDYNKKIKGILTGIFANRLKYRGQIGIHINIGGNKDGFN